MGSTGTMIGYELLTQAVGLNIKIESSEVIEAPSGTMMEIDLRLGEDDVEASSFGLLFALGVMSFADARPRGDSAMNYDDQDQWTVADFLAHLSFRNGKLCLVTDYVRGRMMKTDITLNKSGLVKLHTRSRGEVAATWVTKLQGNKLLRVVES